MSIQDELAKMNKEVEIALKKSEKTTQTEELIQNLLFVLEQTNIVNSDTREVLQERLFEDFYLALMTELNSSFTEENIKALVNAYQSGLSDVQMLHLQLKLYKKNTGQDIEEYAEKLYNEMAERLLNELQIIQQSLKDVEDLTEDQVRVLEGMIQEGKQEEVLEKLDSFNNVDSEIQTQQTNSQYSTIIELVKEGKLQEAKEEINKTIYGGSTN